MTRASAVVLLLSVLLAAAPGAHADRGSALPKVAFDATVKGLVTIRADDCPGKSRNSQGVLVGTNEVLTVRHGIAGCRKVTVRIYGGPAATDSVGTLSADVAHNVARSDLALLALERPVPGARPLRVADKKPQPNDSVFTVARWLDARGARDKVMRVPNASGGTLDTIVNDTARKALEGTHAPALDLPIVNLDGGTIYTGISGAPIVDPAGVVVAIADGGLKDGGAGINWAIPTTEVTQLRVATEPPPGPQEGALAGELFSAEVERAEEPGEGSESPALAQLRCGDLSLVRLGSRTFADLVAASDDSMGLQFISGQADRQALAGKFDIYVDQDTGVVVPVPAESKLNARGDHCEVNFGAGFDAELRLYRFPPTPVAVQAASLDYESRVLQTPGWIPVPGWSYPTPRARYDGLLVNRKALVRVVDMASGRMDVVFETLAARGDLLVGYSVIYRNANLQMANVCDAQPSSSDECRQIREFDRAGISVFATTFARTGWQVAGAGSP
jgi:hypothetical protein